MNHLQVIPTADGSNTIYNSIVGENYHSKHGALQESRHVFVNAGLQYFINQNHAQEVSVLEVGFGTGLNFLLSADFCIAEQIHLDYAGIEAYPLTGKMIGQTGYKQYVGTSIWNNFIEKYPASLQQPVQIDPCCQLQTLNCPLMQFGSEKQYDVIYFDAFASARQPEMWDEKAISHTVKFLKPDGVFVTYAITGNLKRMLKNMGLKVEKAPGAPGKREMLRALKNDAQI